jgi:MerR family mercuric resistance operon transcriptional regulator
MRAITPARAEHMPIGEFSRVSGVNIETIRYCERIKMLPAPQRTASGRRVYGSTELRILAFIRRSRELGFSLNEIRALLRLGAPGKASCSEVKVIATLHLEDIRAKLSDLKKLERLLAKTVARCSGKKHQIAPFWIFSIFAGRPSHRCTAEFWPMTGLGHRAVGDRRKAAAHVRFCSDTGHVNAQQQNAALFH